MIDQQQNVVVGDRQKRGLRKATTADFQLGSALEASGTTSSISGLSVKK